MSSQFPVLSSQTNPARFQLGTENWELRTDYCANSYPAKKKLNSKRAVSSASEPWIALWSMLLAHFFRIVPSSAFDGLVAPISLRRSAMAFSFSSASATIGPLDIKLVSEL